MINFKNKFTEKPAEKNNLIARKESRWLKIGILWALVLWSQSLAACNAIDSDFLLSIKSRLILLGEIHGTVEMPEFAGNLLCHFAQKKQSVMLGLEMSESMQPFLNAYMESTGSALDRNKLLTAPFWKNAGDFGMASVAILNAIETARFLKSKGYSVLLFAYDGSTDENTVKISDSENGRFSRDFIMAATIARRAMQYKDYQIIVLTGNLHGIKTPSDLKMASFIEKFVPVFSVKFIPAKGGESWNCTGKTYETITCGIGKMGRDDSTSATGYDTVIRLAEVHASIPAINAINLHDGATSEVK